MTTFLAQAAAALPATAFDPAAGRRLAYLPAEHTDVIWSAVGPVSWAWAAGAVAVPLLAGFALGWWARGRRRA